MNDQVLFEKQQAVKDQFDKLTVTKAQKDAEVEETVTELNRLQGEWRMLDNLRKELKAAPDPAPAADPASTLPDPTADYDKLAGSTEVKRARK